MSESVVFVDQSTIRPVPWRNLLDFVRRDTFVLSMFFSLLLLGGDLIAIQVGGLTMRIVFPLLMASFGFLYLRQKADVAIPKVLSGLFFLFAIAGAISTLHSLAVVKSVGYTIWVFFDFFVIILLCYNLGRCYPPEKILTLWFTVFRIHVILVIAEFALNVAQNRFDRPHLWFYETSYLAIFLSAYFGSSLYMFLRVGKAYAPDFAASAVVMLLLASATAMFGILFSLIFNIIVARQRLKLLLWSAVLGAIFLGALYLYFRDTVYFSLVAGFFVADASVLDIILVRGGNRIIRLLVGWQAFIQHPWTGVGIGGDSAYMDSIPLPDSSLKYLRPWLETKGQPFCNIFIEVLGTMGIVGFIPFCAILGYSGWQAFQVQRQKALFSPATMAFMMGFLCSILAMQLEGTMLRYYLWAPLGLALGTMAQARTKPPPEQPKDSAAIS